MVLINCVLCKAVLERGAKANPNSNSHTKPMLRHHTLITTNLSCTRGENTLFSGLNFELNSGQCIHVIGPNGCGKTSLLRILCGLRAADDGQIEWRAEGEHDQPGFQARIAYLAHKDALKNELTAIENLEYYQQLEGISDSSALDRCLHQMGILQCADLAAQQLSFGQRRRLAFSRLLIKHFDLWILDEPFTGVDTDGRKIIEDLCVAHLESAGSIILTHHQPLAGGKLGSYLHELRLSQ